MITAGLQDSGTTSVCDAVSGCGWVAGGLAAGGGMGGLGATTRPVDALGAAGLGALTGQVQDLQDVVDRLAGNATVIQSFADTWRRVGESVGQVGQRFGSTAESGTASWRGESGARYRNRAAEVAGALRDTAELSSMVGTLADSMGQVVADARRTAGDQLADLVRRLVSYVRTASAAEGGVTPNVLAQASGMIDAYRTPILGVEDALRRSMSNVESLLDSGGTATVVAGSRGVQVAMNCGPLGQKPLPGEVHAPDPLGNGCGGGGGGGGGRSGTQAPATPPTSTLPTTPPPSNPPPSNPRPSNPPPSVPPSSTSPKPNQPTVFEPPQSVLRRHEKEFLERERELLKRDQELRRNLERLHKQDYERGADYRKQCEAIHGPPPNDGRKYHAHHPFPVEWHKEFYERFGIDTADPKWCSWVDDRTHSQIHKDGYNPNWKNWLDNNPNASREDVVDHARSLANGRYALPWTDEPWAK
ncbi:WXG100 family type VII secretion target [Lentzea sp. NPDC059081]|uniref:WXG100 family type VII secretion target n=1 Tax=Lentzea sp. NPDC059081 TaxID=3346719 RepID=UPI0036BD4599